MKNEKPTPFFSYEKKETAGKKEAEKAILKIINNTLIKTNAKSPQ